MIPLPPSTNESLEWQCSYCKRVNDLGHKTCEGCGAGKAWRQMPEPMYVTTAGIIFNDWRAYQSGEKVYSHVAEERRLNG